MNLFISCTHNNEENDDEQEDRRKRKEAVNQVVSLVINIHNTKEI